MRIDQGTWAVFWSRPGQKWGFHGDVPRALHATAKDAADAFRAMFPRDVVRSVRDASGRFQRFA